MVAASLGKNAIAQLLLDRGASIHDMERDIGSTAIIVAAEHGHSDMVDLLLRNGASANDATDWGRMSLVYAIMARCPEIAK